MYLQYIQYMNLFTYWYRYRVIKYFRSNPASYFELLSSQWQQFEHSVGPIYR